MVKYMKVKVCSGKAKRHWHEEGRVGYVLPVSDFVKSHLCSNHSIFSLNITPCVFGHVHPVSSSISLPCHGAFDLSGEPSPLGENPNALRFVPPQRSLCVLCKGIPVWSDSPVCVCTPVSVPWPVSHAAQTNYPAYSPVCICTPVRVSELCINSVAGYDRKKKGTQNKLAKIKRWKYLAKNTVISDRCD